MKKIIIQVVLSLMSAGITCGQSTIEPNSAVLGEFNKQFKDATNVIWGKANTLSVAQFHIQKELQVAYFDLSGNLVTSGRRIEEGHLPMKLRSDLLALKSRQEKKSGLLTIGNIFEYQGGDSDYTQYATSLENGKEFIVVGTVDGKMTVRKSMKKSSIGPNEISNAIAKAPQN